MSLPTDLARLVDFVRDNVIGDNSAIATPFGMRPLTYLDHTASGRSLRFIVLAPICFQHHHGFPTQFH